METIDGRLKAIRRERKFRLAQFMINEILHSDVYIPFEVEDKINFIFYSISMMGFIMDFQFKLVEEAYFLTRGLI